MRTQSFQVNDTIIIRMFPGEGTVLTVKPNLGLVAAVGKYRTPFVAVT
jgi:hypothetical protein